MRRTLVFSGSILVSLSLGVFGARTAHAGGARNYAADGPYDVAVSTLDASTQLVTPSSGGGPWPLVVASHGWSASGKNQLGWAKHFASYGFVVAVPTFPNAFNPDTATNVGIIGDLVTKLTGAQAATYQVAPGKFGLEGHSAGGLATTVAATTLAPAATVLFDPVDDNGGDGKAAYAKLCSPVLAIFAESGSCNNNAGWLAFEASTKADLVAFKVTSSTHCDGENEPRGLCGPFCGGAADPDRQAVYSHYATAFLLAKVKGDVLAAGALADATVAADTDVSGALHAASTCTTTPTASDAGATTPPSPTSSGSTGTAQPPANGSGNGGGSKNGAANDNGTGASGDSGASDTASGGGCNVAWTNAAAPVSSIALACGALVLAARRRRRR